MKEPPKNINQIMNSPEAANLLKNKEAILALSQSADAQKFIQLLKQTSGGELQAAAEAAMKGDASKLSQLVNHVSENPEGAKVISNLNRNIPK